VSAEQLAGAEAALVAAARGAHALGLRRAGREALQAVKDGEEAKRKSYAALCWLSRPLAPADFEALSSAAPLTVAQDTPVRVLHRRAARVRDKTIYQLSGAPVPGRPQYLTLTMTTQAGTYIKEFVHGDFGRTRPSLGDLLGGCRAEILQLDVTDVHMEV